MTKKLAQLLFFIYILGLIWLVLFKLSFQPLAFLEMTNTRSLNLTPLAMSGGRREVLFNILAFIPFGILLTMNAPKISFLNKWAISILLSFSFESLQYLLAIGATDITDLITNSLGALLGISFYYLLIKVFSKAKVDLVLTISFTILLIFTIIFIRQSIVLGTVRV
ncbi:MULTISPECIES: VanZ family protein [Lactococcus]|uniref:VanZ family protein n=1 Tax=Lactococcus TaxID=1357 RepID=UPI001CDD33CB|nr:MULTISPECIES: VanZ family protein [Lactococcus]MCA2388898.1 VanZ family protein [Lactococcus sp. NH2-7C]MCI1071268.1 VanZ family protein [Lactococcus lactis]WGV30454.1 VanZ family protein [Lactococcus sp. NH2-7C]